MPIYEYACTACGHEFEEWQKMSDAPVRTCPKCKKKKVERLISRTAFQLKGGGWYADLYSSSKPGEAKDGGKGGEAKGKSDGGDSAGASGGSSSDSTAKAAGDSGKTSASAGKSSAKKKESSAKKTEPRAA